MVFLRFLIAVIVITAIMIGGVVLAEKIKPDSLRIFYLGWSLACVAISFVQVFIIRR
jgi:hypothetical protein